MGGAIAGFLIFELDERRHMRTAALAGCALLAVLSVVGAIAVAGSHGLTPNGIGINL